MPQQRHDLRRRRAILRQPRRERVPQRMQTRPPRHPIMQPRTPITRRHQILQRPTTDRLTPPIPQQQRRPPQPHPREPHPTRLQIPPHQLRHRRLHRNRPIPTALTPHMQPLLTRTTHQRPHHQRPHLRRPQPRHQTQRHHQHITLRPRIPRPPNTRHRTLHRSHSHSRQQPLRRVLTPQRLRRQGSGPRPRHRRHRITRQPPLRHTERQKLVPRRPRPRHRTTRMPIREHPERLPQHRRRQLRHHHLSGRPGHHIGHQHRNPSQVPPIRRRRMRRILPRPPRREETLHRNRDQHLHNACITHTTDNPTPPLTRSARHHQKTLPTNQHSTAIAGEWTTTTAPQPTATTSGRAITGTGPPLIRCHGDPGLWDMFDTTTPTLATKQSAGTNAAAATPPATAPTRWPPPSPTSTPATATSACGAPRSSATPGEPHSPLATPSTTPSTSPRLRQRHRPWPRLAPTLRTRPRPTPGPPTPLHPTTHARAHRRRRPRTGRTAMVGGRVHRPPDSHPPRRTNSHAVAGHRPRVQRDHQRRGQAQLARTRPARRLPAAADPDPRRGTGHPAQGEWTPWPKRCRTCAEWRCHTSVTCHDWRTTTPSAGQ